MTKAITDKQREELIRFKGNTYTAANSEHHDVARQRRLHLRFHLFLLTLTDDVHEKFVVFEATLNKFVHIEILTVKVDHAGAVNIDAVDLQ